jgi:hypothetical protein
MSVIIIGKDIIEVIILYNSISERRMQSKGMYAVILQIPENEYFLVYDSISNAYAKEIVSNYLKYHSDDGRPDDIFIKHDKSGHLVNINMYLYYTDNPHTDIYRTPALLNINNEHGNIK